MNHPYHFISNGIFCYKNLREDASIAVLMVSASQGSLLVTFFICVCYSTAMD